MNSCLEQPDKMAIDIIRHIGAHELPYTHIFPSSVLREGLEVTTIQQPQEYTGPRSWFLTPFSNKRTRTP